MIHLVLLGDSIFDNARYVPDRPPVIEQVRRLDSAWQATLLALDGSCAGDVELQFKRLPADATHLFVSVGGNDALGESGMLAQPAASVGDALEVLYESARRFGRRYRAMLKSVLETGRYVTVCTVYDSVPGLGPQELTALGAFNEVILREAISAGVPVIDLRFVCDQAGDYSHLSPIEPSDVGGLKIARRIEEVVRSHDFTLRRTVVYR